MQETKETYSSIWFTNNLRVQDNAALSAACEGKKNVLGIYCFDPRHFKKTKYGFKKTGRYRAQFLIDSIKDLRQQLQSLNIPLFVYNDKPENTILKFCDTYNIDTVYTQKEWTQEEFNVVNFLKSNLSKHLKFIETYDQFLYHPDDINLDWLNIPEIFTNFRKHAEHNCNIRAVSIPKKINQSTITNSTTIPTISDLGFEPFNSHPNSSFPFQGGESNGLNRLNEYIFKTKKIGFYKKTRNGLIGTDYSSKFSPWLANGSLSAKTIYWAIKEFEATHFKNQSTYWLIFELIWRDYFKYISLKHGNAIFKIGGINNHNKDWNFDEEKIDAWINGNTKEPFVNANMIELKKTGWMSNRGRQNVASYLSKTLKQDWRIGAAYFESLLIDYDVHSNYGNWTYAAGVGNDLRDRTFNVRLQADRYDANGKFQKLWLQETLF